MQKTVLPSSPEEFNAAVKQAFATGNQGVQQQLQKYAQHDSHLMRLYNAAKTNQNFAGNSKLQPQTEGTMMTLSQWRDLCEDTWAVYDGTKPKDGCGFNWWGAVGKPGGVSITGSAKGSSKWNKKKRK